MAGSRWCQRRVVRDNGSHENRSRTTVPASWVVHIVRLVSTLAALIALLLSAAGDAVAATPRAPRIERVASCSWDRPGHNPFMGDVVAAVDRYADIPEPVRLRLKQRMQARQYDDLVDIRRDEIVGDYRYEPGIRDMHFGVDRVCREVTRANWSPKAHERGLVYCEDEHCILVPTVCRNVSRIERRPTLVAGAQIAPPEEEAMDFAPPEAGPADATPPQSFAQGGGGGSEALPLWPTGGGAPGDPVDPAPSGPQPWWPTPPSGGPIVFVPPGGGIPGGGGGSPCSDVGFPGGGHLGFSCPIGGGGIPGGGGVPVTPVPEPSTWLSLIAGLALLVATTSRRQRRTVVPSCATQKRS